MIEYLTMFNKARPHVRKELSKMPREAVWLTVSSRLRRNFGSKFASRGRAENIQHGGYFLPREANSSSFAATVRIWLSRSIDHPIRLHGLLT